MSRPSRVWLLQSPAKYFDVVPIFLDSLRNTGYFDWFYVATNSELCLELKIDTVQIALDKDFGWSNNIIEALKYVKDDVFFMGCEDHVLVDIDLDAVDQCFQAVCDNPEIGCIRLTKKKRIKMAEPNNPYSAILKPYHYYVSLQPTIWKKSYLKAIIRPNENAWAFETEASKRAMQIETPKAGVTCKTIFNYHNYMKKGGLFRPGYIQHAKDHEIDLDSEKFHDEWKLGSQNYDYRSIHG